MNNPLAFPTTAWDPERQFMVREEGMELRDYFAAKALQGICASDPSAEWSNDRLATEAYDLADKMLKAREA